MRKLAILSVMGVLLLSLTACPSNPPKQPPPTVIIHRP